MHTTKAVFLCDRCGKFKEIDLMAMCGSCGARLCVACMNDSEYFCRMRPLVGKTSCPIEAKVSRKQVSEYIVVQEDDGEY